MTVNKRLNQIVWQRYKWFIALFVALIVGVSMMNTVGTINSVKDTEKMTTYEYYVKQTNSDAKESKIKNHVSQLDYKKYQADMGYNDGSTILGNAWSEIFLLFIVGVGLFTSLYDLKTKFNEFIFSSGFSRRRYFWKKSGLIFITTLATIVICMIADVGIAKLFISSNYFHVSESFLVLKLGHYIAGYTAIYAVGTIVGILVNGILAATITAFGFLGSWIIFTGAFLNNSMGNPFNYASEYNMEMMGPSVPVQIVIFLILAALMMWAASYFFNNLSLEQDGPYLQFNYLKKPLLIFVTLYIGFIIGGQGRGYTKLSEMIKVGVITGIITFIVAYIVIYRPQNIWQKIQNKSSKNKS